MITTTLPKVAGVLDNCWSVAMNRADKAGQELANALLSRAQGGRPVNLVGYSIGARVVFSCLKEMTKRKQAEGIIQDVVLLGAPVSGSTGGSVCDCVSPFWLL
jgi:thioesterase domain-containing protein